MSPPQISIRFDVAVELSVTFLRMKNILALKLTEKWTRKIIHDMMKLAFFH